MSFQTCMNFFLLWNIIWEIQDIFVHTAEIKGNQNGLVTFYKILFCVQQKKVIWKDMRVRKWWQNLLAVIVQQSSSKSMQYCQVLFYVTKIALLSLLHLSWIQ